MNFIWRHNNCRVLYKHLITHTLLQALQNVVGNYLSFTLSLELHEIKFSDSVTIIIALPYLE